MNGSAAERFGALGITPDAINPADALQLAKQLSWSELSEASAAAGKAYMRDPSPNVRGPGPLSGATHPNAPAGPMRRRPRVSTDLPGFAQATMIMTVLSLLALESPAAGQAVCAGNEEIAKWGPNAKLAGLFDAPKTIAEINRLPREVREILVAGCCLNKTVQLRLTQRFRKGATLASGFHLTAALQIRGLEGLDGILLRCKASLLEAMKGVRGNDGEEVEHAHVKKLIEESRGLRFGCPAAGLKEAGSQKLDMVDVASDRTLCKVVRVSAEQGWYAVAELEVRSVARKADAANAEKVRPPAALASVLRRSSRAFPRVPDPGT